MQPTSVIELSEAVRDSGPLRIIGDGTRRAWSTVECIDDLPNLSLTGLNGVIDFSPNDQVVSVRAGTKIADLQRVLQEQKQCLPIVDDQFSYLGVTGTVAGELAINLPHYLEAQCGSWRDWVLGLTLALADGTICKSGSHAVKNVAGYDVHKLMIGARGTLAVIAEVILRTYPLGSLPNPDVRFRSGPAEKCGWLQRTLRTDFTVAVEASSDLAGWDDPASSTIFRAYDGKAELPRFTSDWVLRSGRGSANLRIEDPTLAKFMARTKSLLDPTGKLNPGEFLDHE